MKFIHTGDIHLGACPDRGFAWSAKRGASLWNSFSRIVRTAEEEKVDLLLIAGDLFNRKPLVRELKEVCSMLAGLSVTKVVLIAGNHDFIGPDSNYNGWEWPDNVAFLGSATISSVYFEDINTEVHGLSYHSEEIRESLYHGLFAPADGRIHILLAHGGDARHIPFSAEPLIRNGFHYIAAGHIHRPQKFKGLPAAFCGSVEPLDRSETGSRGYIRGSIGDMGCRFKFVPASSVRYEDLSVQIDENATCAQVLNKLTSFCAKNPALILNVRLSGRRDPHIHFDLPLLSQAGRIVSIIDDTVPAIDTDALRTEHSNDLVGHFIDAVEKSDKSGGIKKKALDFGLRALLDGR